MRADKDLVNDRVCIHSVTRSGLNQQLQSQAGLRLQGTSPHLDKMAQVIDLQTKPKSRDEVKSQHYIDTKKAACFRFRHYDMT